MANIVVYFGSFRSSCVVLGLVNPPRMSSSTVTPTMRTLGWNIELLATRGDILFAGTFQPDQNAFMTFRDIVDEMRLCFEIPHDEWDSVRCSSSANIWDDVAFGVVGLINISDDHPPIPSFINSKNLDHPVPFLSQGTSQIPDDRPVIQYRVFIHQECTLSADHPVDSHFIGW